ncbi:putative disease resistance protein RGA4 [Acorus gramineus]|uniref:Disease resistance protein RGA4 n=1 Tax=Acorus gramineus TaxID=55184 RepID=A0AAV8ZZS8_ACOGR|nr:putative disease resistance protein RGA4 [Acorus gramineus]
MRLNRLNAFITILISLLSHFHSFPLKFLALFPLLSSIVVGGEAMAEGMIISGVLGVLQEVLGSALVKEIELISGVNGELLKLQSTFTTIEAVLADAEERRVKERALNDWLKKLRDVAYQADNVLDDFRIEALRREAETGNHFLKKVGYTLGPV